MSLVVRMATALYALLPLTEIGDAYLACFGTPRADGERP
jgi:hypothetical protein